MTINKQACDKLKSAAAKAVDNFDPNMFVETRDVLALLDELEAADALNKHLELAIRKSEGCSELLRRKVEAAESRIAEVRGYNVDLAEESRQYQQRIAELEARELVADGIITKVGE
ncbi:ead/Ea22-like family protein [Enterobacter hormaechei]|uniref:ead/Ea22-like family protein n=1 Tax=Enterobacter hormaechei TaxID=158836 RepID=UPI0007965CB7|nr:ead/Ea22-like family protein [Enterobacter hormaechei]SAF94465.1 Uncharacterised protein [Enterobacter hormaechei]VAC58905.1 Uncharacterised protein [Enterobacter hormaechei]VAG11633.1 Uncharacterised protein [Enterobacter hormaechei]DAL65919.1 MAG TPA_asm: Ead/Ea22-like protein [Caudoviricetes sp.]